MGRDARARGDWQGMNWIRKDKRLAIYMRDGMACVYCATGVEAGVTLTLDHIKPHSQGGTNSEKNLVTCCHKCNSVRGDRSVEEFAIAAAGYVDAGVTAKDILKGIADVTARKLTPYRTEAKRILNRRPTWQSAIEFASVN